MSWIRNHTPTLRGVAESIVAHSVIVVFGSLFAGGGVLVLIRQLGLSLDVFVQVLVGAVAIAILAAFVVLILFLRLFNARQFVRAEVEDVLVEAFGGHSRTQTPDSRISSSGPINLGVHVEHFAQLPADLFDRRFMPEQIMTLGCVGLMSLDVRSTGSAVFEEGQLRIKMLSGDSNYQGALVRAIGRRQGPLDDYYHYEPANSEWDLLLDLGDLGPNVGQQLRLLIDSGAAEPPHFHWWISARGQEVAASSYP